MKKLSHELHRDSKRNTLPGKLVGLALMLSTLGFASSAVAEQPYKMVIPIAAGGSMDQISRAIGEQLSLELGEPVIAINRPGAGTLIGLRDVANSTSIDGRTFVISGIGYTTLQFKEGGPAFDKKKLKPVMYVGWQPTVLFTRASIPANNVNEFLKWAKANENPVTFASSGIGSSPHIAAEQFANITGINITNVPMAGSSAFVPALAGGHVDAVFDAPATRSMVDSGKLKALVVGLDEPLPDWPELATTKTTGLDGLKAGTWYGIFVPSATAEAEVKKLNAALNKALKSDLVREKSRMFGISLTGGSPADFSHFLDGEFTRIRQLVHGRGIVIP